MNLLQLEYLIALDNFRHFGKAAEACFVTQPTLSMMIQKLENELDIIIFDRSRQPVTPTDTGVRLIDQSRKVLREVARLKEIVIEEKNTLQGSLKLGIIPTLAPYIIPLFVNAFTEKYEGIKLSISELRTEEIIHKLKTGQLDSGLLVTPLNDLELTEIPLFYEAFVAYSFNLFEKKYLLPEDIDVQELWLLEEGHCFQAQIMNLCELRHKIDNNFEYNAGSIDTLIRLVDNQEGITILPELATFYLTENQRQRVIPFAHPSPVREVSIVTHRDYIKKRIIDALAEEILEAIPSILREREDYTRINI